MSTSRREERVVTSSPADTQALAARLLAEMGPGAVLALHGDLGSGKTCFVQGLARALGVRGPVTSPTFTLINEYTGRLPLFHVDLYRLQTSVAVDELGVEDYLDAGGITAIEWAERGGDWLPARTWHLTFEVLSGESVRAITIRRRVR